MEIKEDDKFFSRLLSKETSMANPSFRVYYGAVSVAIPFVWEAKPGTPKHTNNHLGSEPDREMDLCQHPPLTPPPSYSLHHLNNNSSPVKRSNKIFNGLFPRMMHRRQISSSLSSSSSSSSRLSSSDSSLEMLDPTRTRTRTRTRVRTMSSLEFEVSDHHDMEEEEMRSPKSTLFWVCG